MRVNLHEPSFGEEEIQAATDQMRTTQVTMGKQVRKFEEQCAEYFGSKYALMCNSGSSANLLAVAAALYNPVTKTMLGDEVIVPALSWATTVWPVIQYGFTPVFVDCDRDTLNFDYDKLEAAITPHTKAIMAVHVYGNPCDMGILTALAKKYHLTLIEDTCESMGATFNDKKVGTFGDIGTMSLYYSHHITTFEGGLCFTDDFNLIERMRILRAHGWSREADNRAEYEKQYPDIDPRFIFLDAGYNLRPTEVQAVIGMKQLPKLDGFMLARRKARNLYKIRLRKYEEYFRFQQEQVRGVANWFGFCLTLKDKCPFTRKQITDFLQRNGVETRPIIAGNIARHPALKLYNHRIAGNLDTADNIMQRGFAIGCHHAITEEHVDYVIGVFDWFMKQI